MAAWQLDLSGISPELCKALLAGQLKYDLPLEFATPTGANRTRTALYNLTRDHNCEGAFKISSSKNNPCKLTLKPGSGKKFPTSGLLEERRYDFASGQVGEDEDYIKLLTEEAELVQGRGQQERQIPSQGYGPADPEGLIALLEGDTDETKGK